MIEVSDPEGPSMKASYLALRSATVSWIAAFWASVSGPFNRSVDGLGGRRVEVADLVDGEGFAREELGQDLLGFGRRDLEQLSCSSITCEVVDGVIRSVRRPQKGFH